MTEQNESDNRIVAHNRVAWDRWVEEGDRWTTPVSPAEIAAARDGRCLASGGGQQGPILAAAGANVTVFDNSPSQLRQDELVARREGLVIRTVQGDMRDLSAFAGGSFDLIFHPVSNIFAPEVRPVWCECYRVLRPGGVLMMGTVNPIEYAFDRHLADTQGIFQLKYPLPYSDATDIGEEERTKLYGPNAPYEFSHTLEDQIGGQLDAGFVITGFFEARKDNDRLGRYFPNYIATRAVRLV